jgi:hypothetical protein
MFVNAPKPVGDTGRHAAQRLPLLLVPRGHLVGPLCLQVVPLGSALLVRDERRTHHAFPV